MVNVIADVIPYMNVLNVLYEKMVAWFYKKYKIIACCLDCFFLPRYA